MTASNSATLEAPRIGASEASAYHRDGFLLVENGLNEQDTARPRAVVNELVERNPGMPEIAVLPCIPTKGYPHEGLIGGEKLFEFAVHPVILGIVKELLGPDVLLWGGEILVKQAHTGTASDWHQDGVVRPLRPGPGHSHAQGANVWIAIDDVKVENSCLRYVPGSGRGGIDDHKLELKDIDDLNFPFTPDLSGLDLDTAVDAVLPAGGMAIHDLSCMHASHPNTAGRTRLAVTFRYLDANDAFDRNFATVNGNAVSPPADIPIWLVLGENRNERNNFMIGHRGLEALDQLAERNRALLAGA